MQFTDDYLKSNVDGFTSLIKFKMNSSIVFINVPKNNHTTFKK